MYQKTALIIDDSPTSQAVLKRLLKDFDYHVDAQKSGEEALQYLQANSADVIFLDHIMPGIDGFGVLRHLKSNSRTHHIPVVMYTSQNAARYASEAKALGAIGVLPKQVGSKELASILERAEQASADSAAIATSEFIIEAESAESDATDTATVLEQTEQLTEIELLKQTLHAELDQQRRELLAQQRELTTHLERALLTQSLQLSHWQQRSHWRSIAAGFLILLPLLAAIQFSSKVTELQAELTHMQIDFKQAQLELQNHNNFTAAASASDRDQHKADWDDVKFMLETLIATVEARAGKPPLARQAMQPSPGISRAVANENNGNDTSTPENNEESADKQ